MEERRPSRPAKRRTGLAILVIFGSYFALHAIYVIVMLAVGWLGAKFNHNSDGLVDFLLILAVSFWAGLGAPTIAFRMFRNADQSAAIYAFATGMIVVTLFEVVFSITRKDYQAGPAIIEGILAVAGAFCGLAFVRSQQKIEAPSGSNDSFRGTAR